jgi:hypothetical protein
MERSPRLRMVEGAGRWSGGQDQVELPEDKRSLEPTAFCRGVRPPQPASFPKECLARTTRTMPL